MVECSCARCDDAEIHKQWQRRENGKGIWPSRSAPQSLHPIQPSWLFFHSISRSRLAHVASINDYHLGQAWKGGTQSCILERCENGTKKAQWSLALHWAETNLVIHFSLPIWFCPKANLAAAGGLVQMPARCALGQVSSRSFSIHIVNRALSV